MWHQIMGNALPGTSYNVLRAWEKVKVVGGHPLRGNEANYGKTHTAVKSKPVGCYRLTSYTCYSHSNC